MFTGQTKLDLALHVSTSFTSSVGLNCSSGSNVKDVGFIEWQKLWTSVGSESPGFADLERRIAFYSNRVCVDSSCPSERMTWNGDVIGLRWSE